METSITKIMASRLVTGTANKLRMSGDEMWDLYYSTGIEYLECLKIRIKRKRVFDQVFKPHIGRIGKMSPVEVFEMIEYSPVF